MKKNSQIDQSEIFQKTHTYIYNIYMVQFYVVFII